MLLVADVDVLEGEVGEAVLVAGAHVEEVLRVHLDVADGDVIALRQRHVGTILGLEKLCPGTDNEEGTAQAGDILDGNILVVLRGVRTHLEPEYTGGSLHMDATQDDVMIEQRLGAKRQTTVYLAIGTVLDNDV